MWQGAPARKATSASPVASTTRSREDRLAAGLALGDDALDEAALDDGLGDEAVEERLDAGLLDQPVGDDLEELGVERPAAGLDVRRRAAHLLGAALELDADALEVDGRLVPVPGDGVDADLGDDAAEAAVAVDEGGLRAGPGGGEGGGEAAGSAAHHEHLRLVHDRRRPRRLRDVPHRVLPWREAPVVPSVLTEYGTAVMVHTRRLVHTKTRRGAT